MPNPELLRKKKPLLSQFPCACEQVCLVSSGISRGDSHPRPGCSLCTGTPWACQSREPALNSSSGSFCTEQPHAEILRDPSSPCHHYAPGLSAWLRRAVHLSASAYSRELKRTEKKRRCRQKNWCQLPLSPVEPNGFGSRGSGELPAPRQHRGAALLLSRCIACVVLLFLFFFLSQKNSK